MANFIRNSSWLTLSYGINNLLLFAFNFAIIKFYGAAAHGRFAAGLSLILLLRVVSDLGITAYITKSVSRQPQNTRQILLTSGRLLMFTSIPALFIWYAVALFFPNLNIPGHAFFILWFLSHAFTSVSAHAFMGLQLGAQTFFVQVFNGFSITLGILVLGWRGFTFNTSIIGVNFFVFAGGLAGLLLLAPHARKRKSSEGSIDSLKTILGKSVALWLPNVAITLFPQVMVLLVKAGYGDVQVSVFATLLAWSWLPAALLAPTGQTLFAWRATKSAHINRENQEYLSLYFRFLSWVNLSLALFLFAFSFLILKAYGPTYEQYLVLFSLLVFAQALEYPRFLSTPLLSGGNDQSLAARIELGRFTAVLVLTLCVIFLKLPLITIAAFMIPVHIGTSLYRLYWVHRLHGLRFFRTYIRLGILTGVATSVFLLPFSLPPIAFFLLPLLFLFSGFRISDIKSLGKHGKIALGINR